MWGNFVKKLPSRRFSLNPHSLTPTFSFLKLSQDLIFPNNKSFQETGSLKRSHLYECKGRQTCIVLKNHVGRSFGFSPRSYGSVAEVVTAFEEGVSTGDEVVTAVEEGVSTGDKVDEVQELRHKNRRDEMREVHLRTGFETKEMLRERQFKFETEAWEKTAKEYQELLEDMCKLNLAPSLPYMKSLFLGWFEPLCSRIVAEQELFEHGKIKAPYASYFHQLPADKMAVITMHKLVGLMMKESEHGFASVLQAACMIGDAIEQEVRLNNFLEEAKKKRKDKVMKSEGNAPDAVVQEQEKLSKKVNNLMKKQKLQAVNRIVKEWDNSKPWSQNVKAQVGSRLISLLLEAAYIQPPIDQSGDSSVDVRPAFFRTLRTGKDAMKKFGAIECDPLVRKGLERSANHVVIPYMPMLVRPDKWRGYDKGGYLFLPSYVMRTRRSKQQRAVIKSTPKKNLMAVFQALDTLGSTRWRLNKRVLSVVERIWSTGGGLADMVDFDDIPLPEKPDTDDEALLRKWKWSVKTVKQENAEKHSLRCDTELKLSVARKMKEEKFFFYPHNLDFRGRAYPMHPHLNHLGSDLCRGILEFGEGRPLGKSGLHWLKIQLANLFAGGVDKLSLEGRIAFTENHLEDIFDSADRPLEGRKWWLNAEDPFQCLAVCINLSEALRSSSPEATISHIPVHQDGSCNGLQHYAALGRDKLGAVAVNLVKGEKPADVYSGIAARVLDIMRIDAQKDPSVFPDALRARVLINQVDRKLVKQTVMTSVYGVTFIGARDQIKRRLKERNAIADEELFGAACYAAKTTLTALGEMFEAARSIMSWLGDCAKVIASDNQPVQWITPLGLPVVQPYRKLAQHTVKTSLQYLGLQRETDKVLAQRQRTAFPPNFIHSLDGTHMMMTAVACSRAGLNFAGVHDSYWTHACDVDEMNMILREKFVELYETPILENLLESFQKSFPALVFPPLPERGDFDLNNVLESTYFFN